MDNSSRVAKSQYNFIFSLVNNVVVTILGFVTRTVFVHSLGTSYLGLNGLFTNVLSLLSLAELGVGSAITFSLYKPIAEHSDEKIKSLMGLYKRAYQIIGWVIFGVGTALTPFLKYIVNLDAGVEINYYVIYYMFLLNSVVSYWFFAYRSVIIYANQEGYILTKTETIFALIRSFTQFYVLIAFRNFYLYLALPIIIGILKNIIISNIAGRKYPIINEKNVKPLASDETKGIFKNVFALSLFKISSVVYGATDNIIISTWLGTNIVGLVSNYNMITQLVSTYVNMIFQSMYASIGNLNATESADYKFLVFRRLNLLNFWIYCYCTICLGCFLNPCVKVWLGEEYCLKASTTVILALVFLVPGLNNVINIYKDACGLFKEVQFRAVATAVVNLGVSIVLVRKIGLNGVFIGTIVAYFTTIYQVDPRVVFDKVFKRKVIEYYSVLVKQFALFSVLFLIMYVISQAICISSWGSLIMCFILISLLVNAILVCIYKKTDEFNYLHDIAFTMLQGLKQRLYK